MGDATRHEQLIERQLVKESKRRYRPTADDRLIKLSARKRTGTPDAVLSSTFGPHSKHSAAHR